MLLLVATLLFMPATLAALIYGTGRTRAFAVGTLPPMCIVLFWFTERGGNPSFGFPLGGGFEVKIFYALVIIVVVASGFVAQAVRWCCLRRAN